MSKVPIPAFFAWTPIIGVGNALLPFSGSLPTFFFICVLLGWSTGSLDTGITHVLMLNLGELPGVIDKDMKVGSNIA